NTVCAGVPGYDLTCVSEHCACAVHRAAPCEACKADGDCAAGTCVNKTCVLSCAGSGTCDPVPGFEVTCGGPAGAQYCACNPAKAPSDHIIDVSTAFTLVSEAISTSNPASPGVDYVVGN